MMRNQSNIFFVLLGVASTFSFVTSLRAGLKSKRAIETMTVCRWSTASKRYKPVAIPIDWESRRAQKHLEDHSDMLPGDFLEDCTKLNLACTPVSMVGEPVPNAKCTVYGPNCIPVSLVNTPVSGKTGFMHDKNCQQVPCEGAAVPSMEGFIYDSTCTPSPITVHPAEAILETSESTNLPCVVCPCIDDSFHSITTVAKGSCSRYAKNKWPSGAAIFDANSGAFLEVSVNGTASTCSNSEIDEAILLTPEEAHACIVALGDKCQDIGDPIMPECPCFTPFDLRRTVNASNIDLEASCNPIEYPETANIWEIAPQRSTGNTPADTPHYGYYDYFRLGYSVSRNENYDGFCLLDGDIAMAPTDAEAAACVEIIKSYCQELGHNLTPCL